MSAPTRDSAEPGWMQRAACRTSGQNPDLWHPDYAAKAQIDRAVRICREQCPVRLACARYAETFRVGIWAGFNLNRPDERRQLADWLRRPVPAPKGVVATVGVCAGGCRRPLVSSRYRGRVPAGYARHHAKSVCHGCSVRRKRVAS